MQPNTISPCIGEYDTEECTEPNTQYNFKIFDKMISEGLSTAVIDIDNTITRSHIGLLYLHLHKTTIKNKLLWHCWQSLFITFVMIPLFLIDKCNRNLAQKLTYKLYANYDATTLKRGANDLFETHLKQRFIPEVHDLIFYLKKKNVNITLLSTNIAPIAKLYAKYFECDFYALPLDVVYKTHARKHYIDSNFKQQVIKHFDSSSTLAVADSIYDMSVFKHSKFNVVVCKDIKKWMTSLNAHFIMR